MASLLMLHHPITGFLGPWLVGPVRHVMKTPFPNYLINQSLYYESVLALFVYIYIYTHTQ